MRQRLAASIALLLLACATAAAQLGTRPAEDWIKTLDAPDRIAAMKIPEVVAALQLQRNDIVADLGAGSGPFEPELARAVGPNGNVYAVEVDDAFFPHIRAKAAAAGVGARVKTVLGAFTDPKLPTEVDVALMHDVIHHVEDRAGYLKNVVKYLKPGGRIAIVDYNPANSPHSGDPTLTVSKEQAATWLAPLGFVPVKEVPLAADKWFVIYGRR